jgi:hypothetical protein
VDPLQQRLEVQAVALDDDDLTVHDAALGQVPLERRHELREVAGHRPLVAAAELDLVPVAEHDRPEAVPLRLVVHAAWELADGLGQHRADRGHHG